MPDAQIADPQTAAPAPPGAGGGNDIISVSRQKLDAMLQQLMTRASGGQQSAAQPPTSRNSPESMKQQGYDTKGVPKTGDPSRDIGNSVNQALGNMGTFVHNMVAQHKQSQTRDAMSEWQGFGSALTRAQLAAGDPPNGNPQDPEYKKKMMDILSQDPWIKSNLDPANPKSVKRLKNMSKALNFDPMGSDQENVHRQGLLQHFKVQDALKKMVGAKQKMAQHTQGQQGQSQGSPSSGGANQGLPPNAQDVLRHFMQQTQTQGPDTKTQLEIARLQTELYKADAEAEAKVRTQQASDERQDKRLADADARQDKALQAMSDRQDKALLAHTQLMRDEMKHAAEREWARLDTMGQTKGYNVNTQGKAQKMNLKQGQDVPDSWISEKDAEAISTPTGQGRNRAETAGVILKMNQELGKVLSLDDKKLGAVAGRLEDFKANKVGVNDPDYIYLSQISELAKSATAMMHLGQRGAASTIATGRKFLEGYDVGKMPVANIRAGIKAVNMLAQDYVSEGSVAPIGSPEWNKRYKEATHDLADDDDVEQYRRK